MSVSAYWPPSGGSGSITKVADSTARLALSPADGDVVIQLDNDVLYEYDQTTLSWVVIGGFGVFVDKTGDTMSGELLFTSGQGLDSISAGTTTLNIGATNADIINIGNATCTVNITGTINNNNVTNLTVTDKAITLNSGGAASSGFSAGIEIEEDSSVTGYVKTSADRNSWDFVAPNQTGVISLTSGSDDVVFDLSGASATRTYTGIDASGVIALTSTTLTSGSVAFAGSGGVLTESNSQFFYSAAKDFLGLGTASPAAKLHMSGAITANSWTTTGIGLRMDDQAVTNNSSSGTVSNQTTHSIGQPTFNFTSTATVTDASTLYIKGEPLAGTNATITRPWSVYCPSGRAYFAQGGSFGTITQSDVVRLQCSMTNTNNAANALYAAGVVTITSAGSYQSSATTGDMTMAGTANNTSSVGGIGVDAIARVTNTATVSSNMAIRAITQNLSTGTVTNNYGVRVVAGSNSGTIGSHFSFFADNQTMTTTNSIAYYGGMNSGSGKWNLYQAGSAANYIAGDVYIGQTSAVNSSKFTLVNTAGNASATLSTSQLTTTVSSNGSYDGVSVVGSSIITLSSTANNTSSSAAVGVRGSATVQSTGTGTVTQVAGVSGTVTNSSSGVITTAALVRAVTATNSGAGSIANIIGFDAQAQTAASTLNLGFRGQLAQAATAFNLYMSGTADNYLAGRLLVGTTTTTIAKAVVVGNTTTEVTSAVRAVASQTANLQEWQNSTPVTVASVGVNGSLTAGPTSSSAATHSILGAQKWTTRAVSGNITLDTTTTDMIALVDTTSSAITVTLPAHAAGRILIIKDAGYNAVTNNITVARAGGTGTIDGVSSGYTINANGASITLVSDGSSAWHII